MRFEFDDPFLEDLAYDPDARSPWPEATLDLYLRRLQQIDSAHGLDDLLAAAALDAREVQGDDAKVLLLRIDDGHRLVVRTVKQESKRFILVLEVRAEARGSARGA
jgi:plasmid maintenance system killer protein